MKKTPPFIIILAILAVGCNHGYNAEAIEAINLSLKQSHALAIDRNNAVYGSLEEKMHHPSQHAKAAIWLPKALHVKMLTTVMYLYVDSLQQQLATYSTGDKAAVNQLFEKEGHRLFNKLLVYKQALPEVGDVREFSDSPLFLEGLKKNSKLLKRELDTYFAMDVDTDVDEVTWIARCLKNNPPALAQVVMTMIKNELSLAESMMINYYNNQIGYSCCFCYDIVSMMSVLNYYQVKVGQLLEAIVGIGAACSKARPKVTINNHEVQDTPDGTFIYQFKAQGKAGSYYIPVSIDYYTPGGIKTTFTKQVEYTITD